MNYAKLAFLPLPVVTTGPSSTTSPAKQGGRLTAKRLQVSGYADGTWILESRLAADLPWVTLATVSADGITEIGDKVGLDVRLRCSVAPSSPGSPPKITLGGMDPEA